MVPPFISEGFFGDYGLVVQLVRTPPCHGGGRGFESHPGRHFFIYGQIAQLVEQGTENPRVGGSIPSLATNAGIAQLIERRVANAKVAGLSPVSRSTKTLNNVFFLYLNYSMYSICSKETSHTLCVRCILLTKYIKIYKLHF